MGIFERFFRPKFTAPPPPPPADLTPPQPSMPAGATIESYAIADAVGTLRLGDGQAIRFGRSSCKGFEPVVGASVSLESVSLSRGSWKARVVNLDLDDARYDELLAERDREAGLPSRALEAEEAVATCKELALITVLLREPLPEGTVALRKWASERGLDSGEVSVRAERDIELSIGGLALQTVAGREPFAADELVTRQLPPDFDYGQSFIGLIFGLPGTGRQTRAALAGMRDPWGEDGALRAVSRLVAALSPHATGVVLHRAGHLVLPIDDFVQMLGDLVDPQCRAFAAWLDIGIMQIDGQAKYATFGMDAFDLPDVMTAVTPGERFDRSRRHEAVLYACYCMIQEGRALEEGEQLRVPLSIRIGAWPVDLENRHAELTYAVSDDGSGLLSLLPCDEVEPHRLWRDETGAWFFNAYQALLNDGLAELVASDLIRDLPAKSPQPIDHSVTVRARHDGRGLMIVSNGFGRIALPNASREDCAHIELAAWVCRESFMLVKLVGGLAREAHGAPAGWQPNDTLAMPIEELGIGGFVLADGGQVEMRHSGRVRVLILVPLSPSDYELVRGGGSADWLARHEVSHENWSPFLTRLN